MSDILTTAQAARLLGVSVRTAQLWVESGELPSWKTPGGHRRIPREAVTQLIAGRGGIADGATAVVLARPQHVEAWRNLTRCGFLPEVVDDPLLAAVRIGDLNPSLVVIEDDHEGRNVELLERLDEITVLAPALVVVLSDRTAAPDGIEGPARQLLYIAPDPNVDASIDLISAHARSRLLPPVPEGASFPLAPNEPERLKAVMASGLLHSAKEASFDRVVDLAIRLFDTPIAMFTLLTSSEQWFKSKVGYEGDVTPREWSLCNYTLAANELTVFEDLVADKRVENHPTIAPPFSFRFYAGAPVRDEKGFALGSICIIDRVSRTFSESDRQALATLADAASQTIRIRAQKRHLRHLESRIGRGLPAAAPEAAV